MEDLISAAVVNADWSVVVVLTSSAGESREGTVSLDGVKDDNIVGCITDDDRNFEDILFEALLRECGGGSSWVFGCHDQGFALMRAGWSVSMAAVGRNQANRMNHESIRMNEH